jgi:hypothetical protein
MDGFQMYGGPSWLEEICPVCTEPRWTADNAVWSLHCALCGRVTVLDWFNLSCTSCLIECECYKEILLAELDFVSQLKKDLGIR